MHFHEEYYALNSYKRKINITCFHTFFVPTYGEGVAGWGADMICEQPLRDILNCIVHLSKAFNRKGWRTWIQQL